MKRGEVWWADLGHIPSAPADGPSAFVIWQSDTLTKVLQSVLVVPLTTNLERANLAGTALISASEDGLPEDSVALAFQLRAIQSRHSRQKSERSRKMNSMSWNSQPTKPSVGSNPVKMLVPALPPDARIAQVGIQSCYRRTSGPTAFAEPASPLAGPTDPASSECHTQNTPNTASLGNRKIVHLHHPACGKIFPVVRYHKRQGVSHVVLKLSDSQTQTLPLDWTSVRPELPPQPARSFFHIQDLLSLVELTHKLRRKDP